MDHNELIQRMKEKAGLVQAAAHHQSPYTPFRDEDVCCGFGGSYSLEFPEISAEILRQKLDHVENSAADVLVTDCLGCVLQLRGGMDSSIS